MASPTLQGLGGALHAALAITPPESLSATPPLRMRHTPPVSPSDEEVHTATLQSTTADWYATREAKDPPEIAAVGQGPVTAQPPEPQPCPELELELANRIDAQDSTGGWYEAFVVETRDEQEVKVHYIGWPYGWDEWLPCGDLRLQYLHSFTNPDGTSVRFHA